MPNAAHSRRGEGIGRGFTPPTFRPEEPVTVAAVKQLSSNKKRGDDA